MSVPVWGSTLSGPLPVIGLVSYYLPNYLMGRSSLLSPFRFVHGLLNPMTLCGISNPFELLSPARGQVCYVLLTRSPLSTLLYSVRLACIRHAASVHPEPGSNSPYLFRFELSASRCYPLHPTALACETSPLPRPVYGVPFTHELREEAHVFLCTLFASRKRRIFRRLLTLRCVLFAVPVTVQLLRCFFTSQTAHHNRGATATKNRLHYCLSALTGHRGLRSRACPSVCVAASCPLPPSVVS